MIDKQQRLIDLQIRLETATKRRADFAQTPLGQLVGCHGSCGRCPSCHNSLDCAAWQELLRLSIDLVRLREEFLSSGRKSA